MEYELTEEEADGLDAEGTEFFTRKKLLEWLKEHNDWPASAKLMEIPDPGHLMVKAEVWQSLLEAHGVER